MPHYRVRHETLYTYEEPVSVCHNLAHLLPRNSPRHVWKASELTILPEPSVLSERSDSFGNRLSYFEIHEPHTSLRVIATGEVELAPLEDGGLFAAPAWEATRDLLQAHGDPESIDAFQFTFPSSAVEWNAEVAAYAAASFSAGRSVVEASLDLMSRIYREFKYDPKATTVTTKVADVLAVRRGVCQDFAHLMVAAFRSQGLAARYVSGYLLTVPPPGKPRLVGADASHAWASVWVPGAGWLDLDPTNNQVPSDKHITLAWGRDYNDVCPLRGVILGGGRHAVRVGVDISPMAHEPLPA